MSITKDKMEFAFHMGRHTSADLHQCHRLLRFAATLHSLDEAKCNVPWTDKLENKRKNVEARVQMLCKALGCTPLISYEPMAPALTLKVTDGFTNNYDRTGIVVPQ